MAVEKALAAAHAVVARNAPQICALVAYNAKSFDIWPHAGTVSFSQYHNAVTFIFMANEINLSIVTLPDPVQNRENISRFLGTLG